MPFSYVAAAILVLVAGVISYGSRRPVGAVAQIAVAFAFVIGVFTVMLVIAYLAVIMAAWAEQL